MPIDDLGEKAWKFKEIREYFKLAKKLIETRMKYCKSIIHIIIPDYQVIYK
jgi:hypothetical protein